MSLDWLNEDVKHLDILDQYKGTETWRPCRVVKLGSKKVRVHFVGFGKEYDTEINLRKEARRIAPLFSRSKPSIGSAPRHEFLGNLKAGDYVDVWFKELQRWINSEIAADLGDYILIRSGEPLPTRNGSRTVTRWFPCNSTEMAQAFSLSTVNNGRGNAPGSSSSTTTGGSSQRSGGGGSHSSNNSGGARSGGHGGAYGGGASGGGLGGFGGGLGGGGGGGYSNEPFGYSLKLGDRCQCYDTRNTLLPVTVQKVTRDRVFINYTGYSSRYDEWVARKSDRLRPSRSGQSGGRQRQRRVNWRNWQQVYSFGLSEKHKLQVDEMLSDVMRLHGHIEDVLTSCYSVDRFRNELKEVEDRLAALGLALPASCRTCQLPAIKHVIDSIKDVLGDKEVTDTRMQGAGLEDAYFSSLQSQFAVVPIASDGNCLFAACSAGDQILKALDEGAAVDAAVRAYNAQKPQDKADAANQLRAEVCNQLGSGQDAQQIQRDVGEAVRWKMQNLNKKHGTYDAIYEEMVKANPKDVLEGLDDVKECVTAYLNVMRRSGVYGTALELSIISEILKRPVRIFHHKTGPTPRVVGSDEGGAPISLAFYMHKTHYNLLVDLSLGGSGSGEQKGGGRTVQSEGVGERKEPGEGGIPVSLLPGDGAKRANSQQKPVTVNVLPGQKLNTLIDRAVLEFGAEDKYHTASLSRRNGQGQVIERLGREDVPAQLQRPLVANEVLYLDVGAAK